MFGYKLEHRRDVCIDMQANDLTAALHLWDHTAQLCRVVQSLQLCESAVKVAQLQGKDSCERNR